MYRKSVSKFLALDLKIVGVFPSCIKVLSFRFYMRFCDQKRFEFKIPRV